MSTKYKVSSDIPSSVLCERLEVLAESVTKGRESILREFYMRVPAELDNDADLVISEAAQRIKNIEVDLSSRDIEIESLQNKVNGLQDLAIWMTGCGYDFCQHEYFTKKRDELLKDWKAGESEEIEV